MSRTNFLHIAAALSVALAVMGAGTAIHVPTQKRIKILLKDAVSSAQAQTGDRVHIVVVQDVVVNGYIVFAKGADGLATIDAVHPGAVHVTFNWVHAVDGSKIGIVGDQTNNEAGGSSPGLQPGDVADGLGRANNAVYSAGGPSQVENTVGRVTNTFSQVQGMFGSHASKPAPTASPIVPIGVLVKNPDGVTITSTQKSDDDDTDVR